MRSAQGEEKNYFLESIFLLLIHQKQTMEKLELIKQLEYLVAFQTNCLASGDWESFDNAENKIKGLEEAILGLDEKTGQI